MLLSVCFVRGPGGLFAWTGLVSSEVEQATTGSASALSSLTTSTADFGGPFLVLFFGVFTTGPTAEAAAVSVYSFLYLAWEVFICSDSFVVNSGGAGVPSGITPVKTHGMPSEVI